MTISIDASVLSSYYLARSGSGTAASTSTNASAKKTPTPPWSSRSTAPQMTALTKSVLDGAEFFDANSAKIDVAGADDNYKKLFGLYQGLSALDGLAQQASAKTVGDSEKARLAARFVQGMAQLNDYVGATKFTGFSLAQGVVAASEQTAAGVERETDTYTTQTLQTGALNAPVNAFQGAVSFSLSAKKPSGGSVNVAFDLSEMGSTPRTMPNVVSYLNTKLQAAGLFTRFANVRTPGQPQTVQAGGKTVTLGTAPDSFALQIKGVSTETLSFSAPTVGPAVYLAQTSGLTTGDKPDAVRTLVKASTDPAAGATGASDGKVFALDLGSEVQAVRATQTASDGSVYVLADVTGKTDGQAIKGAMDVALKKYDSAGNLVYTRTLGAADSASGYALAVSADGSRVAVAGSVTGELDSGDSGADPTAPDSFVSVFDAEGQQVWSQRQGAKAGDQATGLAFATDGSLYVSGSTSSAMPGASAVGGQDAYVQGYAPAASANAAQAYTSKFTVQYGSTGMDKPAGVAVNGNAIIAAGVENGHAVVRRYDLQATGAPTLGLVRDLGDLKGGSVAGVAVAADGSVLVAGATHNGALAAGTVTTAYGGGGAAFVVKLSSSLAAAGTDRLSYYNGGGNLTASAMTLSGSKVFIAGQTAVTPPPGQTTAFDTYAAGVDPATGAVSWSQSFRGADRMAAPTAIAVNATGASVLDRLGLPSGTIDYTGSQQLVANTSVRAGDQFYVQAGSGAAKAVTIDATDTLKTLADKVNRALGFAAKAEVVNDKGYDRLKITPSNSRNTITIEAGKTGRDALEALGLPEGEVTAAATPPAATAKVTAATKPTNSLKAAYALKLPTTLNLGTADGVKQAQAQIKDALAAVRSIYIDMTTPPVSATTKGSGTVPAYLTSQIANYHLALARLTGAG